MVNSEITSFEIKFAILAPPSPQSKIWTRPTDIDTKKDALSMAAASSTEIPILATAFCSIREVKAKGPKCKVKGWLL